MKQLDINANYSNMEFSERNPGCPVPMQQSVEWEKWDDLVSFFREYFKQFGDDTSAIDDETFARMVKTIWRFSNVAAFKDGMKIQKEITPSWYEQYVEWTVDIARSTDEYAFNWLDIIPDKAKAALANNKDRHF